MVSDAPKHYSVLLNEIISIITLNMVAHLLTALLDKVDTQKILGFKNTQVIAFDRDVETKKAEEISQKFPERPVFKHKRFSQLSDLKLKNQNIRGVIFDLGYSYTQIKDPVKGLSFHSRGDLNMQMGLNEFSAQEVINKLDTTELEKSLNFLVMKRGKKIAIKIVKERKEKINTNSLVEIIENTKRRKNFRTHSATKVFQALRIFVNTEISELINGLIFASKILKRWNPSSCYFSFIRGQDSKIFF